MGGKVESITAIMILLLIILISPSSMFNGSFVVAGKEDHKDPVETRIYEIEPSEYENWSKICHLGYPVERPIEWNYTFWLYEIKNDTAVGPVADREIVIEFFLLDQYMISKTMTDPKGVVHFNFSTNLVDSNTGKAFMLPAEIDKKNITIRVQFKGDDNYLPYSRTYFTRFYNETVSEEEDTRNGKIPFPLIGSIIMVMAVSAMVIIALIFIKKRRR